jgi:hypothetical protein
MNADMMVSVLRSADYIMPDHPYEDDGDLESTSLYLCSVLVLPYAFTVERVIDSQLIGWFMRDAAGR